MEVASIAVVLITAAFINVAYKRLASHLPRNSRFL
jgi:hypothetical protein